MVVINHQTNETFEATVSGTQRFLYQTMIGRLILKLFASRWFSKLGGLYLSSSISKLHIKGFVKKNKINLDLFEDKKYKSYNDFFSRKIKAENLSFSTNKIDFCSPCDCKMTVYEITQNSVFKIKEAYYQISDLLKNNELAQRYQGGYCLIARLCVEDYHRYHYLDSGFKTSNNFIKGRLHTVNPIALQRYNFYKTNCREYSILHTDNFGDVIQIEVGAMMVGKIKNHHEEYQFSRGEEKGMFLFGGSTIVLLVEKNKLTINPYLIKNTAEGMETIIKCGETIGKSHTKSNS